MRARIIVLEAIVVVILLEIALRIYNPIPFRVKSDRIRLPVREVTEYRHEGTIKLDPVTRDTKNSIGFRGPDPPRDFANRLTIVTVGGSTTECHYLDDGKTWTDAMARAIEKEAPDVWVNNGGLDGQSTHGHLVLLRDFLVTLQPKVIVFLIGVNDVGLEASNTYDQTLDPGRTTALATARGVVTDHSELAALIQNLYRAYRAHQAGFGHSEVDLRLEHREDTSEADIDAEVQRHRERFLDGYAERVEALVRLTRSAGITPVFVTQPALFGPVVDPATGLDLTTILVSSGRNGALAWRVLEAYNEVTRRVAREQSVPLIDLAHELPKDSRLFYDFLHYTNEGAERVGSIVAARLIPVLRQLSFITGR